MSNEHDNDELEGIGEQMQALAARGVAIQARAAVADIEEVLGDGRRLDPVSFVAGGIHHGARHEGAPPEMASSLVAAALNLIAPAIEEAAAEAAGLPDPESAFDDLPVYDPENGS